jgi:opacity protein-like surface antigen
MRSKLSVLVSFLLLGMPTASYAQDSGVMVTLHGGGASPQGDFGDYWHTGWTAGGTAEYVIANRWAVGIDAAVAKSDHDRQSLVTAAPVDHLTLTSVAALVRWTPGSGKSSAPYLSAGIGSYLVEQDFTDDPTASAPLDTRESALGFRGGLGFRWHLAPLASMDISADYHHVTTDQAKSYYDAASFVTFQAGLALGLF